jgi:CRP-like cAMP-binding protein
MKLEHGARLTDEDRVVLRDLSSRMKRIPSNHDISSEGDRPENVHLVMEGFACRYKILADGRRQIMAFLVPGDFCDLHVFILKAMDHTIATLSPCTVVKIPRAQILALTERPAIARAFWWAALVDEATLREWLVNIGARPAEQRVAHLLCELLLRLEAVGLTNGDTYELPITQAELADTTGLTSVHVNRVLQRLRRDGLITLKSKNLMIMDVERLKAFSGFNPNYLHLSDRNGLPEQSL